MCGSRVGDALWGKMMTQTQGEKSYRRGKRDCRKGPCPLRQIRCAHGLLSAGGARAREPTKCPLAGLGGYATDGM